MFLEHILARLDQTEIFVSELIIIWPFQNQASFHSTSLDIVRYYSYNYSHDDYFRSGNHAWSQKHTNKIYTRHIHFIYLVEYINHKKRLVDRKGGWKVEFRDA